MSWMLTMYKVYGCLGYCLGVYSTESEVIAAVESQIKLSTVKRRKLSNAMKQLKAGGLYQIDYDGSGCTVERLKSN